MTELVYLEDAFLRELDSTVVAVDADRHSVVLDPLPDGFVIDIVGLDKQADGGSHVASTGEVGTFAITKTESKGKGNKRIRIALS